MPSSGRASAPTRAKLNNEIKEEVAKEIFGPGQESKANHRPREETVLGYSLPLNNKREESHNNYNQHRGSTKGIG